MKRSCLVGTRAWLAAHPRARRALFVVAGLAVGVVATLGTLDIVFPYPVEKLALDRSPAVRDCHGEPLRRMLAPGQVWRIVRPLDRIAPAMVEATIAAEDRRFRAHGGVDFLAVGRAVWLNITQWRTVSGASTLTMQLARLVEPRPRTYWGKLQEAFRARQIEKILTKEEILYQYLNRAPYGGNLSGVEAAARAYLGKQAADLTLADAALLAGLPQAPSRLRPDRHPDRAVTRRRYVLVRLHEQGRISAEEREAAEGEAVQVRRRPFEWVARHFSVRFDPASLGRLGDEDVRTTLDLRLQEAVEERLARHVGRLQGAGISNGAAVVIENATGAVRVLVGSVRWNDPDLTVGRGSADPDDGQVDATRARRAPGSTLKPFLYAAALDAGVLAPSEILLDVPVAYRDWVPENMDRDCRGLVTLEQALVQSLNLPAVRALESLGVARFLVVLRELGFGTLGAPAARYGLGLALGGCEVTLLDLAHGYTALARGGTFVPLRWVEDPVSAGVPALGPRPWPVFSAEACAVITHILQDRSRLGLSEAGSLPGAGARVAWKTGTSHGHHDAWCVGYDSQFTVGVWLGNPSGRSSAGLVAVEAAAPALHDIFAAIGGRVPEDWPPAPADLVERKVCALTGLPPGPHCRDQETGQALRLRTADAPCPVHRAGGVVRWPEEIDTWLRERGMHPAPSASRPAGATAVIAGPPNDPSGPSGTSPERTSERTPAVEAQPRATADGAADAPSPDFGAPTPAATDAPENAATDAPASAVPASSDPPAPEGAPPRILSPRNGERFVLLPDAVETPRLTLRARAPTSSGPLHWFVDGALVGQVVPADSLPWTLTPGSHRIVVVDAHGRSAAVTIHVGP